MRTIVIILSVLLASPLAAFGGDTSSSEPGVALLKDYRFEDGGYTIAGLTIDRITNSIQAELGDFYTDDIDVLNQMKTSWVTGGPSPVFACGYHYAIFVIQAGTVLESFSINLNEGCNTVVSAEGYYYFDPQKLASFKGKLKKAQRKKKTFSSLAEGRQYLPSLAHANDLLMYFKPDWAEYDGEFDLDIQCAARDLSSPQFDTCREDLEAQIRAAHPDEPFVLSESSRRSSGKMSLTVKCRKTLYEKLNADRTKGKWKDYSPAMALLWKAVPAGAVPAGNTAEADCGNAVHYSCDPDSDTLRVYDRAFCEGTDGSTDVSETPPVPMRGWPVPKDSFRSITFLRDGKFVASRATCKLTARTYLIEVSSCRVGPRQVPLVRISSGGKTAFTGSYGTRCGDAEPLIYFHYATSDTVEIGKRVLHWRKR